MLILVATPEDGGDITWTAGPFEPSKHRRSKYIRGPTAPRMEPATNQPLRQFDSIEGRAQMIQDALHKLEGWWHHNGGTSAPLFAGHTNTAHISKAAADGPTYQDSREHSILSDKHARPALRRWNHRPRGVDCDLP